MSRKNKIKDQPPRQLTVEEAREAFLKQMWVIVDYWDKDSRAASTREKLTGLLFTILAEIDGSSVTIPAMELRPIVTPKDIKFHKTKKQNDFFPKDWFPPGKDIAGELHNLMYKVGMKYGFVK